MQIKLPKKIISGGQTGVDRMGLEVAKILGIPTGGTAPKDYRTNKGNDLSLKQFGVTEDSSYSYRPRTIKNVQDSDITIWFGDQNSPGGKLTINTAKRLKKPYLINPSVEEVISKCEDKIVNIAGNRFETNPEATYLAERTLKTAFKEDT